MAYPRCGSVACMGLWRWAATLLVLVAIAPAACDPPPTMIPPGAGQVISRPISERPIEPPPPAPMDPAVAAAGDEASASGSSAEPAAGGGAGAGTSESAGSNSGSTPAAVADGGACERAVQCASGICEGQGCDADHKGVCVSRKRSCTRDLRAYCGCDGATFRASGNCPGRRYEVKAACKGPASRAR